jgi:hypothetical protein
MARWEYKTLTYVHEPKAFARRRYWADIAGTAYGPKERPRWIAAVTHQMRQLEAALAELDRDGWELVSASVWSEYGTRLGAAVLRRERPT